MATEVSARARSATAAHQCSDNAPIVVGGSPDETFDSIIANIANGAPLAIADLWREWSEPDGGTTLSFTMLTVNDDDHPVMKRLHRPSDEKRSVVIVPPDEHASWLSCRSTDEARSFLRLSPADLMRAEAFPLPPRKPIARPTSGTLPLE